MSAISCGAAKACRAIHPRVDLLKSFGRCRYLRGTPVFHVAVKTKSTILRAPYGRHARSVHVLLGIGPGMPGSLVPVNLWSKPLVKGAAETPTSSSICPY